MWAWLIRVADWRVICTIEPLDRVLIVKIRHRCEIYD